jgi:hypothetical protein
MVALGDPELMRATQSVKLFSSCLVAICAMQLLFLLLRLFGSWEDEGVPSLDDDAAPAAPHPSPSTQQQANDGALFFLQLALNTLGIYVGLIGARSAHTLQPQAAKVRRGGTRCHCVEGGRCQLRGLVYLVSCCGDCMGLMSCLICAALLCMPWLAVWMLTGCLLCFAICPGVLLWAAAGGDLVD